MKYYNDLNMGEGIAGPDSVGAGTATIYSCMGIAFVNRATKFGGLYHYPAKMMRNSNVSGTIQQMIRDINPDEILVTPAEKMAVLGGSDDDDLLLVEALLKKWAPAATVSVAKPGVAAQLLWKEGKPLFNVPPHKIEPSDLGAPTSAEIDLQFRQTMSTARREVEAGTWYYGGDGETDGVLEQGQAAPPSGGGKVKRKKKSIKERCVIM